MRTKRGRFCFVFTASLTSNKPMALPISSDWERHLRAFHESTNASESLRECQIRPRRCKTPAHGIGQLTTALACHRANAFGSAEEYYSTLFHELTHSTGHPSRIGREGIEKLNTFGSESYSKEELIAEMGAAMLAGVAGIERKTLANSAAYLKSWIDVLKSDTRMVVFAASQAQKAADYIQGGAL